MLTLIEAWRGWSGVREGRLSRVARLSLVGCVVGEWQVRQMVFASYVRGWLEEGLLGTSNAVSWQPAELVSSTTGGAAAA